MKNKYYTIGFIISLFVVGAVLVCLTIYLANILSLPEKIVIALIAALSTIVTITGSIFTNRFLTSEQIRKEKEMEFLKVKSEFYHDYLELFLMRLSYMNSGLLWTKEALENERKILIYKMRLPLYASQEVIEFFEKSNSSQADFSRLYELIRIDILNSSLREFENLGTISVHLPNIPIDNSLQMQLDNMKAEYEKFKQSALFNEFVKFISIESNLSSGVIQNNDNHIVLNKLRMEKILDYKQEINIFTLSLRGVNYLKLYKLERLYKE